MGHLKVTVIVADFHLEQDSSKQPSEIHGFNHSIRNKFSFWRELVNNSIFLHIRIWSSLSNWPMVHDVSVLNSHNTDRPNHLAG